jgi:ketosteroid isomerase-like protein
MSEENVEVVRAAFDAWNNGDMEALAEHYRPDTVTWSPEGWPEPGPFCGRDAVMRQFEELKATFDFEALEPMSFRDSGDRVVVRWIWRASGRGPELRQEMSSVYTLRDGKILATEFFWEYTKALEAVGLSE